MVARKRQTQVESFKQLNRLKVLNNCINGRKNKAIKWRIKCTKLYRTISSERVNRYVCVKPEFMYGHVCCKLRNSLGGYGGIKYLGGGSSHGQGSVVTKSAVVTVGDVFRGVFMAVACSILPLFWSVSPFADLHCLNSYPLDRVGSGKFFRGKIYDWLKNGILLNWINFLHSRLLRKDAFYSLYRQQPSG